MLFQMSPKYPQCFGNMLLDGFFRDPQRTGYFAVGEALAAQHENLAALLG